MKHTNTPWELRFNEFDKCFVIGNLECRFITELIHIEKEDAEFIVRAVNSHNELLEAAKMFSRYLEIKEQSRDYHLIDQENYIKTKKAIQKAEGK